MFHKHHHNDFALFEIKLRSPHKNLILLKGNEHECEQVPFQGSVKLSIPEDMHIKKISLTLIGEYKLEFFQRNSDGMVTNQISENHCVLEVGWENLLTDDQGKLIFGDYGDGLMKMSSRASKRSHANSGNNSSTNLAKGAIANNHHNLSKSPPSSTSSSAAPSSRPSFLRTTSSPHFQKTSSSSSSSLIKIPNSGIDGTPFKDSGLTSAHSFLLPKGNYNLPFSTFLPVNISESVEGLKCGHLLYKLDCNIERGRFEKTIHRSKHLRIMRTLHPQSLNLIETMDISNTWPNKVQYQVSLPKKGVAVGATIPLNILIIPIAKGLKLNKVIGVIVQHYHVQTYGGQSPEFEELYGKQEMSIPDAETLPLDQWNFKSHFKVPSSLHKLTQSCDAKNGIIQVKHRLRLSIQLLNKEGHISELRANLPIHLYVSANTGHVVGQHFEIDSHGNFVQQPGQDDILFRKDDPHNKLPNHHHHHHHHHEHGHGHRSHSSLDLRNLGLSSGASSPVHSRTNHPETGSESDSDSSSSDNDIDREEAAPPLYQQHIFDKIFDSTLPQTPLEQFRSQAGSPEHSSVNLAGYFSQSGTNIRSFEEAFERNMQKEKKKSHSNSHSGSALDLTILSKVPSYEYAVDEDCDDDELAPTYSNGEREALGLESAKSAADLLKAINGKRPVLERAMTADPSKLNKRSSKLFFRKA